VTTITVHEDHIEYHDVVHVSFWDEQLDKYTRHNGEDVLRTEVDKAVSWDQVPKTNDPKKKKRK